jgi:hypothetical protein
MGRLHLSDSGEVYASLDHEVTLEMKPEARLFKEPITRPVRILVYGACGAIAFFAEDPELPWRAHQRLRAS